MANSTNTNDTPDSLEAVVNSLNRSAHFLRLFVAPVITLVTMVGAAFVLKCLVRRRHKMKGKDLLLCALMAADLLTAITAVFYNNFLTYGLGKTSIIDGNQLPHVTHSWVCRLWAYFWILGNSLSTNLLCLLSADRIYALCAPMSHKVNMTKTRYCIIIAIFVLVFVAISIHGAILYDSFEYYGSRYCYLSLTINSSVQAAVQAYTNLVMNGFLPSIFLLFANCFLCYRIHSIRRGARRLTEAAAPTSSSATSMTELRASVTLVALAFAFLVGCAPRSCVYFAQFLLYSGLWVDADSMTEPLLFAVGINSSFAFYLNCSINWIIYCVRVPIFREQLPRICCCPKEGGESSSQNYLQEMSGRTAPPLQ